VIQYSSEVSAAISAKRPLVALESTIISHGLPRPNNLEVALEVEEIVRSEGATPATIAIIDGVIHIGLEKGELDRVAQDDNFTKASIRDLATTTASGLSAATTVAATSHIAHLAGIEYFATGGLGGVHRGASESWDESVVCAGVKSILDIPATLERLETLSVPIIGYRTKKFPGFYLPDSGYTIEHEASSPTEIGAIWQARKEVGTANSGLVVANPTPLPMNPTLHERLLRDGLAMAQKKNVIGKAVTPFLLEFFHTNSDGESLKVNIEIIKSNARLAAQIASS
jgi:pseudouridine-5'-phosphate glycosidase